MFLICWFLISFDDIDTVCSVFNKGQFIIFPMILLLCLSSPIYGLQKCGRQLCFFENILYSTVRDHWNDVCTTTSWPRMKAWGGRNGFAMEVTNDKGYCVYLPFTRIGSMLVQRGYPWKQSSTAVLGVSCCTHTR
jgi:hypothetical protein